MPSPASANGALAFWFDLASNYSYLSAMRIEALAAQHGVGIVWRPFLLGPIFRDRGWSNSPFVLDPVRGAYAWTDTARQAAKHGLPWRRPSVFPRNSVLATRIALLLAGTPAIGPFVRACMTHNFVHDEDIADPALLARILTALGLDAQDLAQAAAREESRAAVRAQIEAARAMGIFGAPSFVVDGELFWGDDRLEDALAACVRSMQHGAPFTHP